MNESKEKPSQAAKPMVRIRNKFNRREEG